MKALVHWDLPFFQNTYLGIQAIQVPTFCGSHNQQGAPSVPTSVGHDVADSVVANVDMSRVLCWS